MSWSMIHFAGRRAHAHDDDQELFMALASAFLASSSAFDDISWLHEWRAYWLDHLQTYGNGCSDVALERFLDSDEKKRLFKDFLNQYRGWLGRYGEAIPADEVNLILAHRPEPWGLRFLKPCRVEPLLDFVTTIEGVIDGSPAKASLLGEKDAVLTIGDLVALEEGFLRATISVESDWYHATVSFEVAATRLREFVDSIDAVLSSGVGQCEFINDDGNVDLRIEMSQLGRVVATGVLIKDMGDVAKLTFEVRTDRYSLDVFQSGLRRHLHSSSG